MHKRLAQCGKSECYGPTNDPRERVNVAEQDQQTTPAIKIKKYANRRLYNTATSSYVTLENLCQMVKDGQDFVVEDAKSGEDITRSVLTQIRSEEHTSELQSLMRISYAVFCLNKKKIH